jgi:hypothetical protein
MAIIFVAIISTKNAIITAVTCHSRETECAVAVKAIAGVSHTRINPNIAV